MDDMLTIFSDASFCYKSGAAGWGAWGIGNGLKRGIVTGGELVMDRRMSSPSHAELLAMSHALSWFDNAGWLDGASAVMLQSDSIEALCCVRALVPNARFTAGDGERDVKKLKGGSFGGRLGQDACQNIRDRLGTRVLFIRHVKAHNSDGTGRTWVNNKCDEEAKSHMRALRSRLRSAAHHADKETV